MTKEEIENEINELEEKRFIIDMVDRWDNNDSKAYIELSHKIQVLKNKLYLMEDNNVNNKEE